MSEPVLNAEVPAEAAGAATESAGAGAAAESAGVSVVITDAAAARVRELLDEEKNDTLKLRIFISGGGCSGFQYGFTFDDEQSDDDFAFSKAGVTFLVDSMSYQYLTGAEIDYRNDLQAAQFVIRNPNVTSTCGCGSSFSV